jgi:hypothetical protein
MNKVYSIQIPGVASAYGDLDAMAYHARRAAAEMAEAKEGTEFSVYLAVVENIPGDAVRVLTEVTGDADVITYVLRRKLAAERKAITPAVAE